MDIKILEKMISENYSTYEISKRMNCGQSTVRYWLKKYKLKTNRSNTSNKLCLECSQTLKGRQYMFCSNKCKQANWNKNNEDKKDKGWRKKQERGIVFKTKYTLENNGCEICNYKKNLAALTFHHRIPSEKCFLLSMRDLGMLDADKLDVELSKCDLLCVNCHMEMESPNLTIHENASVKHFTTTTGFNRKLELLDVFGHKCSRCGYSKNYRALSFHHLDPSTKSFNLDINTCQKRKMGELLEEAAKCIVLCGNCHHEEHHPHLNL